MPIRPCTKCGLKVLVTESQVAASNFLCQRCQSATSSPAPAAKPAGGSTRSVVKVNCPFCKANFSGSIPSKPAKGSCPVCRKDLILLPDGTIQAAASFDLARWQASRKAAAGAVDAAFPEPAKLPPAGDDPTLMTPGKLDLGDHTMLGMGDMGGGPSKRPPEPMKSASSSDLESMPVPGGMGDHTMLGMGMADLGGPKLPGLPGSSLDSMPLPGGLGDHTMLGMSGNPGPEVESIPLPANLSDQTMLGMGDVGAAPAAPPAMPVLPPPPKPVKAVPTPAPPRRSPPPPKSEPDPNDATEVSHTRPTARPIPGLVTDEEPLPEPGIDRETARPARTPAPGRPSRSLPIPAPTAQPSGASSVSTGKLAIGWILLLLPLLAGLGLGLASGSLGQLLDGVSKASLKGFQKIHQQIKGR